MGSTQRLMLTISAPALIALRCQIRHLESAQRPNNVRQTMTTGSMTSRMAAHRPHLPLLLQCHCHRPTARLLTMQKLVTSGETHTSRTSFTIARNSTMRPRVAGTAEVFSSSKPSGVFDLASSADGSFEAQAFFCPWVNTRAPGVGTGIAMRWGNDIVQVVKASEEADLTDFFVNGEKVSWDQLGNATSNMGKDVSGIGGLSSGFMYMQQMKTNRHQGRNKYPVCAGNGQDTIVEVAAHGNYKNYWSGVTIRTSQPGSSGICSVKDGHMGGLDVQEQYRTDKKKILFSSRQMNHLCGVCNLGMHDHICGAPGHDATPEQVCDSVGASIETAKTECGKVFQDGTEWFNVCVMEECASGVEAVSVSKIEEHLQALMVEDEE